MIVTFEELEKAGINVAEYWKNQGYRYADIRNDQGMIYLYITKDNIESATVLYPDDWRKISYLLLTKLEEQVKSAVFSEVEPKQDTTIRKLRMPQIREYVYTRYGRLIGQIGEIKCHQDNPSVVVKSFLHNGKFVGDIRIDELEPFCECEWKLTTDISFGFGD